jgi:hypothetical protein
VSEKGGGVLSWPSSGNHIHATHTHTHTTDVNMLMFCCVVYLEGAVELVDGLLHELALGLHLPQFLQLLLQPRLMVCVYMLDINVCIYAVSGW